MTGNNKNRLNLSIDASLDKRARVYMIENDIKTLSRLIEMAIAEYLDNHSNSNLGGEKETKKQ